ncbi:MAG: hypothetical protein P1V20_31635 [Verrucomicrobiales bacterium]|nr:hypothetical protein [Verrucomicrobiales bacterium]
MRPRQQGAAAHGEKMKILLYSSLVICLSQALLTAGEMRQWTNTAGRSINAELLSLEGEDATLQLDNGRKYTVALSGLSAADREFAMKWAEEQAALASAPKPKTEPIMATPGKVLYQSTLASSGGWSSPHGAWTTSESGLTGAERASDNHGAVYKMPLNFKDVIIEFDIMPGESKSASFGIDDSSDHVCRVSIYTSGFQARKDDHDHEGPDVAKPFNRVEEELEADEWHTVRIEILDKEMLAQIGKEISLGMDPLLAGQKTKCGFVVSGGKAGFRNLTIWEALPNSDWEKTGPRLRRKLDVE